MTEEIKENDKEIDNNIHEDDIESHDYDGIKELNNAAPAWIIILFIVTIGFSGFYAIRYFGHPGNQMDQASEYKQVIEKAEAEKKAILVARRAESGEISLDDILASGAKMYAEKGCLACHGVNGEGNNIGPNLTDNFWINGCSEEDIINIIKEGKPTKGMTPYKTMMSEEQIEHLSKYILSSLVGSNPANGKAAQGDECIN